MKKNIIFTMVDMNLNGAALSLVNFLNLLDYNKYNGEIFIIKECEKEVIDKLPKDVKVTYLYKDNPYFDLNFFKGLKKIFKDNKKDYLCAFIINKLFKYVNCKPIKKLKISLRRVYIPNEIYDVGLCFDEQSFKYLKKINAKKKIVRYAYGEVVSMEDINNKPYNFCDYVVAQCEGLKEDLAYKNKVDIDKIKVIHNIFDNDKIIEKSNEFNVERKRKYIFSTCARIVPLKRIDIIPLVCEKLIKKGIRDFKWYIIGEPEKEKYLEPIRENIEKTNTNDYIEWTGKLSNPYPYIKNSDIYIQTSNVDAWPRSVMEALILGTPVLCTKTKGGVEQITEGINGELCEIDNPEDMAEKLASMLENKYKFEFRVNNEEIMNNYYELF